MHFQSDELSAYQVQDEHRCRGHKLLPRVRLGQDALSAAGGRVLVAPGAEFAGHRKNGTSKTWLASAWAYCACVEGYSTYHRRLLQRRAAPFLNSLGQK